MSLPDTITDDDYVVLMQDVCLEPLIANWSVWPALMSPVSFALHLRQRLLPALQSFVDAPAVHAAAALDPKMYGGSFLSLGADAAGEVAALIERTRRDCAPLLALADELTKFNAALQDEAYGFSLHEFYEQVPSSLRGLVELVYDTNHHPQLHVFEELAKLAYPLAAHQQILLHRTAPTRRPFFMSTPRLPRADQLLLPMPFDDARIDTLARLRTEAMPFGHVAATLGLGAQERDVLRAMCTPQAPAAAVPAHVNGLRVRYMGHACMLFETPTQSILVDPFVSTERDGQSHFSIHDLPPRIDVAVITHAHQDHASAEMLLQMRHRIGRILVPANNAGNVADPSLKLFLQTLGFERIDVLNPLDAVELNEGRLVSIPTTGEHAELNIESKQSIALTLCSRTFLFLVDADGRNPDLYRQVMPRIGPVDMMFIGMECEGAPLNWLYEPVLGSPVTPRINESRRLSGADSERAWSIADVVKPGKVVIYGMGQEPWMQYLMGLQYSPDSVQLVEADRFIARCQAHGIPAQRYYLKAELHFEALQQAA